MKKYIVIYNRKKNKSIKSHYFHFIIFLKKNLFTYNISIMNGMNMATISGGTSIQDLQKQDQYDNLQKQNHENRTF